MKIPVNTGAASVVVLRQNSDSTQLLLMKRAENDGDFWSHVAGGIEPGETAWQAALREVAEETGLEVDDFYASDHIEQFYHHQSNQIMLLPVFVAWVASDAEVVLNEEHSDYRWCPLDEAKSLTPFASQHKIYEHVWTHFVERSPHPFKRINLNAREQ